MDENGRILIGVAIDKWKLRTYKQAIQKAGFEIESVAEDFIAESSLIRVIVTNEQEKLNLAFLLKKLERKYSQRNKMN